MTERTPVVLSPPAHPPVIVGIDPSLSHTGVSIFRDGVEAKSFAMVTTPEERRPDRFMKQAEGLRMELQAIDHRSPTWVVMEAEIWTSIQASGSDSAAIQAIFQIEIRKAMLERLRRSAGEPSQVIRYVAVNVAQIKKWLGAKEKSEVLLQVYKRYHREFTDHNLADAYTAAVIGVNLYGYATKKQLWPETTKPQVEVLDKLMVGGFRWEEPPQPKKKGKKG